MQFLADFFELTTNAQKDTVGGRRFSTESFTSGFGFSSIISISSEPVRKGESEFTDSQRRSVDRRVMLFDTLSGSAVASASAATT